MTFDLKQGSVNIFVFKITSVCRSIMHPMGNTKHVKHILNDCRTFKLIDLKQLQITSVIS